MKFFLPFDFRKHFQTPKNKNNEKIKITNREMIKKFIAVTAGVMVVIGAWNIPSSLGAGCSYSGFDPKPTASLSAKTTGEILNDISKNTTLAQEVERITTAIDAVQASYKSSNGHYWKGIISNEIVPTLGNTTTFKNRDCVGRDEKSWADVGIAETSLPFSVSVSPYYRDSDEGYTISFFVQESRRTFLKTISRGFEAAQRMHDWELHATAEGLALKQFDFLKTLSDFLKTGYAYAADSNSRDFEESNGDYAQAADSADLSLTGAYTFDFEFNPESIATGGSNRIISKLGAAGSRSYQLSLASATSMRMTHSSDGTATTDTTINFTTSFATGTWYRITVTHDGSGNIKAYVNCTQEFTGANTTSSIYDGTQNFRLGAQVNASDPQTIEKFDGLLNNVAIYNAVIPPTSNNEADAIDLNNENLNAYWALENNGNDTAGADVTADNLTFTGTTNSASVAGQLCIPPSPPLSNVLSAHKTTTQTLNSTTLQNDDELKLRLATSTIYELRGTIFASSTSAVPDILFRFTGVSGMDVNIGYITSSADELLLGTGTTTTSAAVSVPANTPIAINFSGTVAMGTESGLLTLQWAKANSGGSAMAVLKGSYLFAETLP